MNYVAHEENLRLYSFRPHVDTNGQDLEANGYAFIHHHHNIGVEVRTSHLITN